MSNLRVILTVLLIIAGQGCSNTKQKSLSLFAPLETGNAYTAEQYIKLTEKSTSTWEKNYLLLQATELLITAGSHTKATKILDHLDYAELDHQQHSYRKILLAKIHLAEQQPQQALNSLTGIYHDKLDKDLNKKLYTTKAAIFFRIDEPLEAIQELIHLEKFLTEPEKNDNQKIIWQTLNQLTPYYLHVAQQSNFNDTMKGWLAIAYISKQYDHNHEQLKRAILVWKKRFPNHPGFMVASFADDEHTTNIIPNSIDKIALLLPLSGNFANSAAAIQDGILSSYYHQEGNKPAITLYDTNQQTVIVSYKQAVQDNNDVIIGPLLKDDITKLSKLNLQIPVLALNNFNHSLGNDMIFQFGLTPEAESIAIASKAWQDGHKNALIITPNNDWGTRVKNSFSNLWQEQGGIVIDSLQVANNANLTELLKTKLAIKESNARAKLLTSLGLKFNFEPRSRQDIHCILLATNPTQARQIKPLLNFYYASNIKVYGTSNIYSGTYNKNTDQDLNGIQFCDMPWLLDRTIKARSTYQTLHGKGQTSFEKSARLYALGIDAYKIVNQFERLLTMPDIGISGMTGLLKISDNNIIERQLSWATITNGIPVLNNQRN